MIYFSCICGMKFKVNDQYAGRSTKYPNCKQPLIVPLLEPTQANVPEGQIDGMPSSLDQAGLDAEPRVRHTHHGKLPYQGSRNSRFASA